MYVCVYMYIHTQVQIQFSWVQLLSHVWLFAAPWTSARQATLSITKSRILLKLMSIEGADQLRLNVEARLGGEIDEDILPSRGSAQGFIKHQNSNPQL